MRAAFRTYGEKSCTKLNFERGILNEDTLENHKRALGPFAPETKSLRLDHEHANGLAEHTEGCERQKEGHEHFAGLMNSDSLHT
jgi:hypothetical protein